MGVRENHGEPQPLIEVVPFTQSNPNSVRQFADWDEYTEYLTAQSPAKPVRRDAAKPSPAGPCGVCGTALAEGASAGWFKTSAPNTLPAGFTPDPAAPHIYTTWQTCGSCEPLRGTVGVSLRVASAARSIGIPAGQITATFVKAVEGVEGNRFRPGTPALFPGPVMFSEIPGANPSSAPVGSPWSFVDSEALRAAVDTAKTEASATHFVFPENGFCCVCGCDRQPRGSALYKENGRWYCEFCGKLDHEAQTLGVSLVGLALADRAGVPHNPEIAERYNVKAGVRSPSGEPFGTVDMARLAKTEQARLEKLAATASAGNKPSIAVIDMTITEDTE